MTDPATQNALILRLLRKGKSLTQLDALKSPIRSTRLAARIYDLKGEGYNIVATTEKRRGKRYARYRLMRRAA